MTRCPLILTMVLFACSGCGSSGQRVTVPFVRCHHVSEPASHGSGGEPVYLAAISQVVTGNGSGDAPIRRFPQGTGTYVFHSGNIVGRDFTDQGGTEQPPPELWSGQLKSGERLMVLVYLATSAPEGTANQSEPFSSALMSAIGKASSLKEDEKATLTHMGMTARDSEAFGKGGSETIGAFAILVTGPSLTRAADIRVIPILDARDAQAGLVGGARVECDGMRSRYQVGVAMAKQK
jgi:hypothetical protein